MDAALVTADVIDKVDEKLDNLYDGVQTSLGPWVKT